MTKENTENTRRKPKPREDSYTVARRLLYIFNLLRVRNKGNKFTASEALDALSAQDHNITQRTVQRYMKELSDNCIGIVKDKNTPAGYWYESTVGEDLLQMSRETALAACLVEAHLKHLLPSTELKHLKPIFQHASKVIDKNPSAQRYRELLRKIAIFPRGWQLIPPEIINEQIFDAVMSALLTSRRIKIQYQGSKDKTPTERTIEPLGFVDRSGVYYVVGFEVGSDGLLRGEGKPKNWVMHRIKEVTALSEFGYPKNFQIENHARDGNLNRVYKREPQKVRLRLTAEAGAHLREGESKISAHHKIIKQTENYLEIECSVPDTDEFRWWVLEKGAGCEVLSPQYLRDEIEKTLREALSLYTGVRVEKTG